MTATASRRRLLAIAGAFAAPLALAWAGGLASCSSASSQTGTDVPDGGAADATSATESSTRCLLCEDAAVDVPLPVLVKGTLDQVCGSPDGCHGAAAGGMGIQIGAEFKYIIDVTSTENPPMKRVVPGDPEHSYLYLKLACEGGVVDSCMPLGDSPQPSLVSLFHAWIEAGAPTP